MDYVSPACLMLLTASFMLNIHFGLILRAIKKAPPKKTLEVNAADLLHDLTTKGHAVVNVSVIDAENLLLRSPRT